ncbi:MAG TPA: hypothetical protein VLA15_08900, partial [Desulfurivibrionaceae bacterium]|nr:hypothetical protein [Desulfurivibrionaceae bacterium]
DPGPRFDWVRLARQGLAIAAPSGFFWPQIRPPEAPPGDTGTEDGLLEALATIGYTADLPLDTLLGAFRLRFCPGRSGPAEPADLALAQEIARRFPVDRATDRA